MPDTPKPAVLHARVSHRKSGLRGPCLSRVHPAVQLGPYANGNKVHYSVKLFTPGLVSRRMWALLGNSSTSTVAS